MNPNNKAGTTPQVSTPAFPQTPQNITKSEEIKKIYTKVLGRTVSESDLAYIINANISENDLIKRMIDSEEHAELVRARQELILIKTESEKIQKESRSILAKAEDTEYVNNSLKNLVVEKTNSIQQYKEESEKKDEVIARMQKDNAILLRRIRKANEGFLVKIKNLIFKNM